MSTIPLISPWCSCASLFSLPRVRPLWGDSAERPGRLLRHCTRAVFVCDRSSNGVRNASGSTASGARGAGEETKKTHTGGQPLDRCDVAAAARLLCAANPPHSATHSKCILVCSFADSKDTLLGPQTRVSNSCRRPCRVRTRFVCRWALCSNGAPPSSDSSPEQLRVRVSSECRLRQHGGRPRSIQEAGQDWRRKLRGCVQSVSPASNRSQLHTQACMTAIMRADHANQPKR